MCLVKVSRHILPLMLAMLKTLPILFILFALTPYLLKTTLTETIMFGIPSTIIMMVAGQHMSNILTVKFVYLFILCQYFRLKLKNLNETAGKERIRFKRIPSILRSFDALCREIEEYNTTYWSHFLLNIWLAFGVPTMIWINAFALLPVSILFKIILFYISTITSVLFLSGLSSAASVNYEASKSYKLFNLQTCQISKIKGRNVYRLKVNFHQWIK